MTTKQVTGDNTRCSAIADGLHDALHQFKSCRQLHNYDKSRLKRYAIGE